MYITKLIYNSADYELNIKRYEKSRKTILLLNTSQRDTFYFYFGIPGKHPSWSSYIYTDLIRWLSEYGVTAKIQNNCFTVHSRILIESKEISSRDYSNTRLTLRYFDEYGISKDELINRVDQATKRYVALILEAK